jgi:hypothetical protein
MKLFWVLMKAGELIIRFKSMFMAGFSERNHVLSP